MSNSAVDIVNQALTLIGQPNITSLEDDNRRAIKANEVYDDCLAEILAMHTWNEATKRVLISPEDATPAFGYTNQFVLPADFIRLIRVHDLDLEYRIENGRILANVDTLGIIYIYRLTDVTKMPKLMQSALAQRIAMSLAMPLTSSATMLKQAEDLFKATMTNATFVDSVQQTSTDQMTGSTWLAGRLGQLPPDRAGDSGSV